MMTNAGSGLIRVVYFSRNRIAGCDAEVARQIEDILAVSRANNARCGVTGALIYNDGVFGQVLEGPVEAVEETFERIQLDDRHGGVTLLDIAPIAARRFAVWSMGFVGRADAAVRRGGLASAPDFDIAALGGEEIYVLLHGLMLRNEAVSRAA